MERRGREERQQTIEVKEAATRRGLQSDREDCRGRGDRGRM